MTKMMGGGVRELRYSLSFYRKGAAVRGKLSSVAKGGEYR